MTIFQDFVRWYNNKDVVPTLEVMQKMMQFYHNKMVDMFKFGCTLPYFANICLHKSTNNEFYPFVEAEKDLHDKIGECLTGGPSIVFCLEKRLWIKHIFKTQTPVKFSPCQCVKKCPLELTLDGKLILNLRSLKLCKINPGKLRT